MARLPQLPPIDHVDRALFVDRVLAPDVTLDGYAGGAFASIACWSRHTFEASLEHSADAVEVVLRPGAAPAGGGGPPREGIRPPKGGGGGGPPREAHPAPQGRGAERALPLGSRGVPRRRVLLSRGVARARGGARARAGGRGVAVPHHDRVPLGAGLRGNGAGVFVHAALARTRPGSAPDRAGAPSHVGSRRISPPGSQLLGTVCVNPVRSNGTRSTIVGPCHPTKTWTRSRPAITSRWRYIASSSRWRSGTRRSPRDCGAPLCAPRVASRADPVSAIAACSRRAGIGPSARRRRSRSISRSDSRRISSPRKIVRSWRVSVAGRCSTP